MSGQYVHFIIKKIIKNEGGSYFYYKKIKCENGEVSEIIP